MGNVLAIIPARSGSKSVKDKNIRIMNGKPMLAYSIEHALQSKKIDRVIVSTDSPHYQEIAKEYGAEAPFLRPAEIAQDLSLDIEVFQHTLRWLQENEGYQADICVHLRPTHPIRDPEDIDKMISILENNPELSAVRSVSPAKETPYKMWLFPDETSDLMQPLASCSVPEAYNAPRQQLPKAYMQNACIDVIRSDTIMNKNSMTGNKIAGYKMDYDFDVDTEEEFLNAERAQLLFMAAKENRTLKICCDIDGIIAAKTQANDYSQAEPKENNISIINALYQTGCHITLFTARGYKTGIDWEQTTKEQMDRWNVKYHELLFGKPDADIYIDDKFFNIEELKLLLHRRKQ